MKVDTVTMTGIGPVEFEEWASWEAAEAAAREADELGGPASAVGVLPNGSAWQYWAPTAQWTRGQRGPDGILRFYAP